jgi:tetratricopeptide (TPR) repeat protein
LPLERVILAGAFLVAAALTATTSIVGIQAEADATAPAAITVDYPSNNSIFPPDIIAPVVRWRDASDAAKFWRIDIRFGSRGPHLKAESDGPRPRIGEIDERVVTSTNEPPALTPEQAAGHTWTPDEKTWAAIRKYSVKEPATVTITGFAGEPDRQPLSQGQVTISTSADPVGAPIFYRDVPLIPSATNKGIISPIPKNSLHLVAWRLRDISQPSSHLLMTGISTCVNCHSFSRDGKTMGIDVDGPDNDRGLYSLMPIKRQTTMGSADIVKWSTFQGPLGGNLRIGFMSQVSPDGRYVLTTINDPRSSQTEAHKNDIADRYYVQNFLNYKFLQVFYPTRGILAWYSRETGHLQPLPGADDDRFVQAGAVWSPDGKYIVFLRARARSAYPAGFEKATYATDPKETQIQYDLYRIPFNDGKGGTPERIEGASENGMSNSFPKVSPDGKWIVFVEAHNGLLMRPDSKLYIVPVQGGKARMLNCNTSLMNSWHSFSPNGHWLVFSSKALSPYTQMYLTHIDDDGNDSPAILVENSTAANRAVNIPEFVNVKPGSWDTLEAPLADFFHEIDQGASLNRDGKTDDAIVHFRKAIELYPGDARAHYDLGLALERKGQEPDAIVEYQAALREDPGNSMNTAVYTDLGLALARTGKMDEAIESYQKAVAANPRDARAHIGLGAAFLQRDRVQDSIEQCRAALEIDPASPEAHNTLGVDLARTGNLTDAVANLSRAVELNPDSFEFQFNLGRVLAAASNFSEALTHFQKAVDLSGGKDEKSLSFLAFMYSETNQPEQAVQAAQRALAIAEQTGDQSAAQDLRQRIAAWQGGHGN